MKKLGKWGSIAGASLMGLNLAICGFSALKNWQFWVLFGTAFMWAAAAHLHGEYLNTTEER